jgi:putative serine protease PepD
LSETPETPASPEAPKPRTRPTAAEKRAAAQAAAQPTIVDPIAAPTTEPKRRSSLPVVAAVAAAALIGGVSGAGVSLWAVSQNDDKPSTSISAAPNTVTVNDPEDATNITAVAVKAAASVVTISVHDGNNGGTGSGVVLTADGYILTNTHVVTLEGATSSPDVSVETSDGRLFDATIVGTDPIADLAVIKVKGVTDLAPATFADSSKLNVGDTAIAIGAPLGLAGTVTNGIVSSLNRSISIASSAVPDQKDGSGDTGETPFDFWGFGDQGGSANQSKATISLAVIQTDAAINPGNSGGALLDGNGEVIGINVAIASAGSSNGQSGSIGVGFAIPSNMAKRIADEIIDTGKATHGLLGASVLDVTEDESASDSAVVGASVKEIVSGGAAEKAGLKVGDVITAFNGIHITGKTDLTAQVRSLAAGAKATVTYVRDGKSDTVTVTLGELKL